MRDRPFNQSEIWAAIEASQIILYYQPVVVLRSHQLVGYEALARWQHPELGLVMPCSFIPVVEEDEELSLAFCAAVIEQTCAAIARSKAHWISFNASPRTFCYPHFADMVFGAIARHDIAPNRLCVELTERVEIIGRQEEKTIDRLLSRHVLLALDDFGTGYNSLLRLAGLVRDCSKIKIDRSLVVRVDSADSMEAVIVRHLVDLGRELRKQTVAEGIETWEQSIALWGMGCELGQGYYFSKPLPEVD